MTQYPHDEFDDVPEDGPRQGAHRGLRPTVRVGARELAAIVLAGVLTLGVGVFAFLNAPADAGTTPAATTPTATTPTATTPRPSPPAASPATP
ncbi:hypothetical protein QYM41_04180 [Kocuria sp. CPCC 205268]|uniref:hypothetical protein n=1 Tax=Kocuria oxytropis TaxID=3058913 RepID=UPI0034D7A1D4